MFKATQFNQTVLFQTNQFHINIVFFIETRLNIKTTLFQSIQLSVRTVSISKTVLFQTFQFSISPTFSSIWAIDRTQSGATTPGQSEPNSDGNERNLNIRLISVISRAPVLGWGLTTLHRSSRCILQPEPTGPRDIVINALDYDCLVSEFRLQTL